MPSNGQRLTPLEMLAKLVSFDTVSTKSNLPLIEFVESYLQSWNVPYVRIPNETGDKAALYATVGPQDRGGIVLSGHTDVVPVQGTYLMETASGETFDAEIPAFSLDIPRTKRVLH